jgi:hypothetical protein
LLGGLAVAAGVGLAWYIGHKRRERELEQRAWREHEQWQKTSSRSLKRQGRKSRL